MFTSPWGTEVTLSFFFRLFCISKVPNEVPLESENNFSYEAKKKKMTRAPPHKRPTAPREPAEKEASPPGPGATDSPQKEMMWLLSSWTNFRVTASSMICFTWKGRQLEGAPQCNSGDILITTFLAHPPHCIFCRSKACAWDSSTPTFFRLFAWAALRCHTECHLP